MLATPLGKPARLRSGDSVGVVAPAGVVDPDRLAAGIRVLESWGLEAVLGAAVFARRAYLAGSDDARLADVQRMIDDPRVRAVFCARGGYGSQRLVPGLDLRKLAAAPKPIVGYSDITALLGAALGAGVVAIHGPMVATDLARGLAAHSLDHLRALLTDVDYRWEASVPVAVRPGQATGRLVGGCLSVVVTTLGTPWALDTRGAILFLEDVHESPYRIDRLLTQLRQAGRFTDVAGVVFGTMAGCRTIDGVGALAVVRDCFADAPYPVGFGLTAGHDPAATGIENLALPLGVPVTLDVDGGRLVALESAVV
ncbi:MAG: LD-carboxypeptidase [Acidimicrobiales bacterium]